MKQFADLTRKVYSTYQQIIKPHFVSNVKNLNQRSLRVIDRNIKINPRSPHVLNRFDQAAKNLSEAGQNNIRILRGWAKSKGWKKSPNPQGGPEKWGIYRNGQFEWRIVIKPEGSTRAGLHPRSNVPRFDARLETDPLGQSYINPFERKTGNWQIGTHLPIETYH